jgi:cell division protease FtsH
MGGRIAEEIFLAQRTSGASNDIERASEIARRMVCELGMSETLGPLAYPWNNSGEGSAPIVSEATAQLVDQEVRSLIAQACTTARSIIEQRRRVVEALAAELLVVESLDADGIKAVIARMA